ncbi:hypothetical protein CP965_05965 [Halarcobacter mediterraneus]|uniref:Glycoprotease n=1 Tax=Halarcobacter mediterraneus TaxID=2023153 RepID=A0A4Q1B3F2_9BACT|nr:hypothetical protein [Halarcobacter mediterraneus]RXK13345.1 hypothetical protein CP965_05965 [Halarcobacter mediterraneus]
MTEVLVVSISKPLLIGIYKNKDLIEEFEVEGMTSDFLPLTFNKIIKKYNINRINYVNTPGSYMAIKVAYVFLKTLSISKDIEFYACSGFEFNGNTPIKALGKKYFINENDTIKVDFLDNNTKIQDFKLPKSLKEINFSLETLPIYNLPAV